MMSSGDPNSGFLQIKKQFDITQRYRIDIDHGLVFGNDSYFRISDIYTFQFEARFFSALTALSLMLFAANVPTEILAYIKQSFFTFDMQYYQL